MTPTRQDDALLELACIRARRERCICMCCAKSARLAQRSGTPVASMPAGAPYAGAFCAEFWPSVASRFMFICVAVFFTALGRGDLRVIMTTMKLKCTYVARVIAATDTLHGWTVLRAKQAPLTRCTRLVDVPAGFLRPARKLAHLPNGTTA